MNRFFKQLHAFKTPDINHIMSDLIPLIGIKDLSGTGQVHHHYEWQNGL